MKLSKMVSFFFHSFMFWWNMISASNTDISRTQFLLLILRSPSFPLSSSKRKVPPNLILISATLKSIIHKRMFFNDPLRAGLHYKGYTGREMLAKTPSGGLVYFGNRTSAFTDKLHVWRTDTFPSKCLFCQCNFIYTKRVCQKNDVYTCCNFLFPAIHQHTWML